MHKLSIQVLAAAALLLSGAAAAFGADTEGMLAACRARAAKTLRVNPSAVTVKYEGQRTDRTHAVNGGAATRAGEQTFQCSFNASGSRITRFVVNKPSPQQKSGGSALGDVAERAGAGRFNATSMIPCAEYAGQPMGQCDCGVARAPGGTAAVAVKQRSGRKRIIFFEKGKAVSSDWSQADGKGGFRVTKNADLFIITIGDERYEIPEAVVFGG